MNKIGWCDYTFNPVWGCYRDCPYCYARKIAKRFAVPMFKKELRNTFTSWNGTGDYLNNLKQFRPTWIESNFQKKFPRKPSRIFVNSMGDISYWQPEWMKRVLKKIKEYPQHTFLFLTKNYNVYRDYSFPRNCWLGITATDIKEYCDWTVSFKNIRFVSIEPMLNFFPNCFKKKYTDWIIIGAETGNKKNKIIPKREWIQELVRVRDFGISVFMKDSLKPIWGENLIQEFPE
ncbi:MAG: DUF5131 family protein [Spirochaetes bacterium]|nr:DUF5131 family protein [Spirochaetota bacterium]